MKLPTPRVTSRKGMRTLDTIGHKREFIKLKEIMTIAPVNMLSTLIPIFNGTKATRPMKFPIKSTIVLVIPLRYDIFSISGS